MRDPQFIIFTGPMFGSKTTRMLAAIDRLQWQKRKFAAFKPKIDDRYGTKRISTHNGGSIEAFEVATGEELLEIYSERKGYDIVAVDEAFMIKGVGGVLVNLFKLGNTVIISSLQLSSWGEPFEEMREMMPWATKIAVCPAVCPITGKNAYYSYCKKAKTGDILIGGAESYEPRCFEHHEHVNESKNK
jgi:thymidine kinase